MSTNLLINLCYTAAAVLFIFGLKFLGSPATARRDNTLSALGMLLAVIVTLLEEPRLVPAVAPLRRLSITAAALGLGKGPKVFGASQSPVRRGWRS